MEVEVVSKYYTRYSPHNHNKLPPWASAEYVVNKNGLGPVFVVYMFALNPPPLSLSLSLSLSLAFLLLSCHPLSPVHIYSVPFPFKGRGERYQGE